MPWGGTLLDTICIGVALALGSPLTLAAPGQSVVPFLLPTKLYQLSQLSSTVIIKLERENWNQTLNLI